MIGAGCATRVLYSFISLWYFGQSPNLRRATAAKSVELEEYTVISLEKRLEAGARGVTFLPFRGPWGSDLAKTPYGRDSLKIIDCPFTNEPVWLAQALVPDVALVHADRADPHGNVQFIGAGFGHSRSARKTIVSVEEITTVGQIRATSSMTAIPGIHVDAVVEVPYGAHPNACPGRYAQDVWHWRTYVEAAQGADSYRAYLERHIWDARSHADYLEAVGGVRTMLLLQRLTREGMTYGE